MMNNGKKHTKLVDLMLKTALLEAVCIAGGVTGWYVTGRLFWVYAALFLMAGAVTIPALIRMKRMRDRGEL